MARRFSGTTIGLASRTKGQNMKLHKLLVVTALSTLVGTGVVLCQDTNTVPPLPGTLPGGGTDVIALINLLIVALTPIVVQFIKSVIPKLPAFTLNLLAPVLGALFGWLLNTMGVDVASGWGAAIYGGLATWLFELTKNVKDYLAGLGSTAPA